MIYAEDVYSATFDANIDHIVGALYQRIDSLERAVDALERQVDHLKAHPSLPEVFS